MNETRDIDNNDYDLQQQLFLTVTMNETKDIIYCEYAFPMNKVLW